jgi:hypothetical protein
MGNSAAALAKEYVLAVAPVFAILMATISGFLFTKSQMFALCVAVIGVLALALRYGEELKRCGFAAGLAIYGIPGRLLFTGVLWASCRSHRRGRLKWKGREYPAGTPGASK